MFRLLVKFLCIMVGIMVTDNDGVKVRVKILGLGYVRLALRAPLCLVSVSRLAVWCSGNALVSINAVALHRARLVLGCGDCLRAGKLSHYVTSHPGQLGLSSFRGR